MSRHANIRNSFRTGIKWEVVRTYDYEYFEALVDENTQLRVRKEGSEWIAEQFDKDQEGFFEINAGWTESFNTIFEAFDFAELADVN